MALAAATCSAALDACAFASVVTQPANRKILQNEQKKWRFMFRLLMLLGGYVATYFTSPVLRYQPRSAFLRYSCPTITVSRQRRCYGLFWFARDRHDRSSGCAFGSRNEVRSSRVALACRLTWYGSASEEFREGSFQLAGGLRPSPGASRHPLPVGEGMT